MYREVFLSGYCRCTDSSRTVCAEQEDCEISTDCNFGSCPYEKECTVAKRIQEMKLEA